MRVDLESDFDSIDPALAVLPQTWQVEYATCLKLMNFRDSEGAAGSIPRPEAAALARVSKDGKTYTFRIRSGLRFNSGVEVTAANFAFTINRDLNPKMASPGAIYLRDIVGADAVQKGKTLSASGVTVLDRRRLRIRLQRPAPDFLSRLTLPYLCALPLDTPIDPHGIGAPVAAAGPYYIDAWHPGRSALLKRNPYYQGPRPHHFDQIAYTFGSSLETQQLRLESDQTDLGQIPPAAAGDLAARFGINRSRFFVKPQLTLWFLALNNEWHLFRNNAQLGRAVNYVVDRRAMAIQHGAFAGTITDQILPIGLPAYKKWSIYPLRTPDYRTATKLARGHTRDGRAELWTFNFGFGPTVAQVVAADLERIGIKTHITLMDPVTLRTRAGTRGAHYDIMVAGWSADYPDPFNFINRLLDGNTLTETNNVNFSYFNEPHWNRRMNAASRLSGRARDRSYALLDRDLMTSAAPIVPYLASNARVFVSARRGCFTYQLVYGTDLAALCLK
jgi:peptide/nickel transport system substrate-binding protein